MADPGNRPPIVVTHEDGLRFAAQVGPHRVITDQPLHAGGTDAGPSPLELLGAALGSCIALYVHQYCKTRGLSDEGLRIEVAQRSERNPSRVGAFDVRVVVPAGLPPGHGELLERVARSCPVHNTLEHAPKVSVTIDAPVLAAGGPIAR